MEEFDAVIIGAGHQGLIAATLLAATFPVLEMYADILGGMSVVEGGAGRLPSAIAGLPRNRGGTVLTGTRVARVDLDPARASGVTLADGRVIRAPTASSVPRACRTWSTACSRTQPCPPT